jgi:hypothetical protein
VNSDELIRSLATDLRRVRRLRDVEGRTLLWAAFALACVSIGTAVIGHRSDLSDRLRDPTYLVENGSLLLMFVVSARSAFQLSIPGMERGRVTRTLPVVGLLLWVSLIAVRLVPGASPPASQPGVMCVERMTGLALAPAVALLAMLRRAAPLRRGWAGVCALLAAGSLAMLGTQMLCMRDEPRHVFVWHVGPVVAAALVGAGLGKLFLSRRAAGRRPPAAPAS